MTSFVYFTIILIGLLCVAFYTGVLFCKWMIKRDEAHKKAMDSQIIRRTFPTDLI